jgi:ribonucleotide reductase beta subunit family protein with ferritin-like domain
MGSANLLKVIAQSYRDLNKERTNELRLQRLKQTENVSEYLIHFSQYVARVKWDERAKMTQFYKGLKISIKDAMTIQKYPKI